jgi:Cu2+-exporting ATPase
MATEFQEYNLPVEGLDSEQDSIILEKALSKVSGVETLRVELNNQRAVIRTSHRETLASAVQVIRGLGYRVPVLKQTFPVLEMSCAACAVSVESMLNTRPGVLSAAVNYASGNVAVEYIPGAVLPEGLRQVVRSIGYDLVLEENREKGDTLENLQRSRYLKLRRKTIWALLLSIPVVVIGMFIMDMHDGQAGIPYANEIMWVLSTPVVFWLGRDFFIHAWKQARHGTAGMDTLVALSTGVAWLFSAFNTVYPQFWHNRGLHAHVYFEAAAVIIAFILLGKLLEEKAKGNTSSAIRKLMGLQPKTVTMVEPDGQLREIPVEQVVPGQILMVKPGEKIAVDGTVTGGNTWVDESMLSGEPVPVLKQEDDPVFAGTINQKGSIRFRADKVGSETMLARIIRMVQDAQGSKAPVQKLVDRIAGIFVPVVIGIALTAFVAWILWGGENGFTRGLLALITVLVIACPCALGLATPTAIMVGVGKGAEKGILIKDAESLEMARKVNAVILDKTGTLTIGKPEVAEAWWAEDSAALRQLLFSIERQSEHPLAEAVVNHLGGMESVTVDQFESITGQGVQAVVAGERYLVGNRRLMQSHGVAIPPAVDEMAVRWASEAKTVVWFSGVEKVSALIAIADQIKDTSAKAVEALQKSGIEVYMLTGDNETTAAAIARQAGIRHFRAEVLPEQKAAFVRELQEQGKTVAMAGDGINDSAALAQADVSIAMGKGSDIAMEVAKMTIISSDLGKIPEAIKLSAATVRTIRENLFWAFIYNLIGIPIAAGILYPITGFLLNPMIAGAAMALSSVSVVTNSLRLKWKK